MGHRHDHGYAHKSVKNIRTAFFLNLAFTVAEIIGGIWTNSVAIVADAVHDLGDSLSLGFSWYLESKAQQEGDNKFSFGYQRFSLLGALINGLVLLLGSFFVLNETIPRLLSPEPTHAQGMLYFALLGVAVNGAAVLRLKGGHTQNEKMLTWHLMEDVLGWVAVLIVSIVLLFTDWYILDPILSILILAFILYNVARNLKQTMMVFLQGVPEEVTSSFLASIVSVVLRRGETCAIRTCRS